MPFKNVVWRGGYKKIFAGGGGGLMFNREVGNVQKRGDLKRTGWRKNRGGGGGGPQKKTIIKFEKLPDTKY